MALITTAGLNISHDHTKKTATPVVRTSVQFTNLELQVMAAFPGRWFKLKCELWAKDTLRDDPARPTDQTDDLLYTFNEVYFFPDGNQASVESRTFQHVVGEGLLNEDQGADEIYAIVRLTNLITNVTVIRKTNIIVHSFS
jgi:hypothetical protein